MLINVTSLSEYMGGNMYLQVDMIFKKPIHVYLFAKYTFCPQIVLDFGDTKLNQTSFLPKNIHQ